MVGTGLCRFWVGLTLPPCVLPVFPLVLTRLLRGLFLFRIIFYYFEVIFSFIRLFISHSGIYKVVTLY